jgi:hypothetical protein
MEKRSRRRTGDLVTQAASQGRSDPCRGHCSSAFGGRPEKSCSLRRLPLPQGGIRQILVCLSPAAPPRRSCWLPRDCSDAVLWTNRRLGHSLSGKRTLISLWPSTTISQWKPGGTAHCVGHFRYLNRQKWPQRWLPAAEPPLCGRQTHRPCGRRRKGSMKLRGTAPVQIARPSRPGYRGDNRQRRSDRKREPHLSRRNDSGCPLE